MLEYASQSQGSARKRLIDQAKLIIKKAEEKSEETSNNTEEETNNTEEAKNKTEDDNSNKFSKTRFNRARTLLQTLED